MDYPIWEVGIGGGMVMAIVAVLHVIVSHFAVGGGLVIAVTETLAVRRDDWEMRELARRSSLVLILVSTVFGAVSGVGIWVVAGLISPAAIASLIHSYVWGWAIEWVFFIVEIVTALVYYATWGKISKGAHLLLGWVYFASAYLSLVIINGIITFQLTPGSWLQTQSFWDGFFNPTYWPGIALRTGIAVMMAAVFMVFPALRSGREGPRLVRFLGLWLVAGTVITAVGLLWWEAQLPELVQALFAGQHAVLPALAATRSFTVVALAATAVFGLIFLVLLPRRVKAVLPGVLVMLMAFAAFAGYERLREGVRKPFLIHGYMFSNGLRISDIEPINANGLRSLTGWVGRRGSDKPAELGRALFVTECSICHTLDGYQGIRPLLPTFGDMVTVVRDQPPGAGSEAYAERCARCHTDVSAEDMMAALPSADEMEAEPEMYHELVDGMIAATVLELRDSATLFSGDATDISPPYMPPFVGDDDEAEALAAYLSALAPGATANREGGA
jgi:mono/diheme cytochrome c family protein/MFS family permease